MLLRTWVWPSSTTTPSSSLISSAARSSTLCAKPTPLPDSPTSLKRADKNNNGNAATPLNGDQPQFRENPEINAKIDAYIQANPKRWDYIQSMSRERMARTIILQDVQKQERTERIRNGVLKKLNENPELKKAYKTLVKNLPEEQQEKMMANLAMRTQRTVTRG